MGKHEIVTNSLLEIGVTLEKWFIKQQLVFILQVIHNLHSDM